MYTITIPHTQQGCPALKLKTTNRNYGRVVTQLGIENGISVTTTEEVEPREVKYKGVETEAQRVVREQKEAAAKARAAAEAKKAAKK